MNAPLTLSNDQRAVVRKAITAHPGWKAYSADHGITSADLTSSRCLDACAALGLDAAAIIGGETPLRAPQRAVEAKSAPNAPEDALAALSALQRLLGGAVDEGKVRAIVDDALAPVLESLGKPVLRVVDPDFHINRVRGAYGNPVICLNLLPMPQAHWLLNHLDHC